VGIPLWATVDAFVTKCTRNSWVNFVVENDCRCLYMKHDAVSIESTLHVDHQSSYFYTLYRPLFYWMILLILIILQLKKQNFSIVCLWCCWKERLCSFAPTTGRLQLTETGLSLRCCCMKASGSSTILPPRPHRPTNCKVISAQWRTVTSLKLSTFQDCTVFKNIATCDVILVRRKYM